MLKMYNWKKEPPVLSLLHLKSKTYIAVRLIYNCDLFNIHKKFKFWKIHKFGSTYFTLERLQYHLIIYFFSKLTIALKGF